MPMKQAAANPYVSGDVFSSVFGANTDAGDEDGLPLSERDAMPADEAPRTMAESNPNRIRG